MWWRKRNRGSQKILDKIERVLIVNFSNFLLGREELNTEWCRKERVVNR